MFNLVPQNFVYWETFHAYTHIIHSSSKILDFINLARTGSIEEFTTAIEHYLRYTAINFQICIDENDEDCNILPFIDFEDLASELYREINESSEAYIGNYQTTIAYEFLQDDKGVLNTFQAKAKSDSPEIYDELKEFVVDSMPYTGDVSDLCRYMLTASYEAIDYNLIIEWLKQ